MKIPTRLYNADMAGRPPTKEAPPFGQRLAALRKARELTQQQLAEALGVSLEMLVYYERRAKNPGTEFVQKAAEFFGSSVDELLGREVSTSRKPGPPSHLEQRIAALRELPRDKQKVVLQVLDAFLQNAQPSKA
jgi:transcriptional regulator with XRE-family HTH domain